MVIAVNENKLRRAIEDESVCRRIYGADMAKKMKLRIATLTAAESLADFWPPKSGPERCHELKGHLKGIFSVDLKQPYRLLFKPRGETSDAAESGQSNKSQANEEDQDELDRWKTIKEIEILRIEDTHG